VPTRLEEALEALAKLGRREGLHEPGQARAVVVTGEG
jgi:hypothetical protein